MKRFLLPCAVALAALATPWVRADEPKAEVVKDRTAYFPRKHVPLKGTAIGVLVSSPQPILSLEGRSGPPDSMCFARGLTSYRWVYVPTMENAIITNLQVPVGDGSEKQVYAALNMANARSVVPWGVSEPYCLVEVTINGGKGSPADQSFVATNFKVLDGSAKYPLKVNEQITRLKKAYADYLKAQNVTIETAMKDAAKKALGDKKATGPRERSEQMYVTWLPESDSLLVRFRTKLSDGAFTMVRGPGLPPRTPRDPLPPKALRRARPPFEVPIKSGIAFGIELGRGYVVNAKGEMTRVEEVPITSFTQTIGRGPLPPGRLPPGRLPPGRVPPGRVAPGVPPGR